uniref:Uncharacterized protein n=1 Tax=Tanacetum cinerariifolium TaxID=118510 RepID=A0A6L2J367_TANCI|nr:hypothetical protein [Tanacetum cinerariifolium]
MVGGIGPGSDLSRMNPTYSISACLSDCLCTICHPNLHGQFLLSCMLWRSGCSQGTQICFLLSSQLLLNEIKVLTPFQMSLEFALMPLVGLDAHVLDYIRGKRLPTSAYVFAQEAAVNTGSSDGGSGGECGGESWKVYGREREGYIIVSSSDSEDINEGPSKRKVPKEDINEGPSKGKLPPLRSSARPRPEVGPELEKLFNPEKETKDKSSMDTFPGSTDEETSDTESTDKNITVGTIGKNILSYEDTIEKYVPVVKSASKKALKQSQELCLD